MTEYKPKKLWNTSYIMMLILSTLTSMGFSMVSPIMAKYAISLGATIGLAGAIAGLFSITALIGRPVSGYISDRLNKKKIMLVATIVLALSNFGYALSASPSVLVVFRIMHGLAFSVSGTASVSLGASFIPEERMGEGIGFMGLGFIISRALGPNLGVILLDKFGYFSVFMAAFAVVGLSAVFMTMLKYEYKPAKTEKSKNGFKIKIGDLIAKDLLMLAVVTGCLSVMNGLIGSFLVNLGDEKNILGISMYFTVNAVVLFAIRPISGKLLDKKGLMFIAFPAFLLAIGAALFLGFANSLWMVLAASALYAVGQGSAQPAFQSTCIKKAGPARVGVAVSTYFIGADIGNGLGPMIGGVIADASSFSMVYFFGALVLALGMVLLFINDRKDKKKKAEA